MYAGQETVHLLEFGNPRSVQQCAHVFHIHTPGSLPRAVYNIIILQQFIQYIIFYTPDNTRIRSDGHMAEYIRNRNRYFFYRRGHAPFRPSRYMDGRTERTHDVPNCPADDGTNNKQMNITHSVHNCSTLDGPDAGRTRARGKQIISIFKRVMVMCRQLFSKQYVC